ASQWTGYRRGTILNLANTPQNKVLKSCFEQKLAQQSQESVRTLEIKRSVIQDFRNDGKSHNQAEIRRSPGLQDFGGRIPGGCARPSQLHGQRENQTWATTIGRSPQRGSGASSRRSSGSKHNEAVRHPSC